MSFYEQWTVAGSNSCKEDGHSNNYYYTGIDDVMTSVQRRRSIDMEIMVFGKDSNTKEAPEPILTEGSFSNKHTWPTIKISIIITM